MAHDETTSRFHLLHNVRDCLNNAFPRISSMATRTSSSPYVLTQVTCALYTKLLDKHLQIYWMIPSLEDNGDLQPIPAKTLSNLCLWGTVRSKDQAGLYYEWGLSFAMLLVHSYSLKLSEERLVWMDRVEIRSEVEPLAKLKLLFGWSPIFLVFLQCFHRNGALGFVRTDATWIHFPLQVMKTIESNEPDVPFIYI